MAHWEPYEADMEVFLDEAEDQLELDLVEALDCSVQFFILQPSSSYTKDSEEEDKPGPSKKKHFSSSKHQRVPSFEPTDITHPRASNQAPPQVVAKYVQSDFHQGFIKEVRARLRAECPRPDLVSEVTDTPETDPSLVTFLRKYSKDPKKGRVWAWCNCKDKLLDMSSPLKKDPQIPISCQRI
ncbi:hypothetical protein NDU88_003396 [Pleurodeles waltl]|uniref:Uncharacterized protein n=1 Tax=Pleurodeles waltl TaxID=8319 RepID=A0AAV7M3A1_PLEWA|nr:hypothetical protein NDU88_003396 [Pleurodeles waltl]